MTTATQAFSAIRSRLEEQCPTIAFRWQNESAEPLPDTADQSFVFVSFDASAGTLASFGGGRGANRYRNSARCEAFAFVPRGWGMAVATDLAEQVAAALRSYRTDEVNCLEATVYPGGDGSTLQPPGFDSDVGNYAYAGAEVLFSYDQIG